VKKLLFCTFVFEKGGASHHNTELIKLLSTRFDITLLSKREFLTSEIENVDLIENDSYAIRRGVKNVFGILKNMSIAAKCAKKLKPDIVLISVYETRSFAIGRLLFERNTNIAVIENNNIDLLTKWLNRICYKSFAKSVKHFVFESYIGEYIAEKYRIPDNLIYVMPHIMYPSESPPRRDDKCETDFDCVALSNSNDESTIAKIIESERDNSILKKNNIRMFIKSRKTEFDNDYLVVKTGFIPIEDYHAMIDNCKIVYTPFPKSYKYRMSGSIIDSFSSHKRVVSSSFLLAEEYSRLYPNIIQVEDNPKDALELISKLCRLELSSCSTDFSKFEKDHSNSRMLSAVEEACK
jgi:hypothetical protein